MGGAATSDLGLVHKANCGPATVAGVDNELCAHKVPPRCPPRFRSAKALSVLSRPRPIRVRELRAKDRCVGAAVVPVAAVAEASRHAGLISPDGSLSGRPSAIDGP